MIFCFRRKGTLVEKQRFQKSMADEYKSNLAVRKRSNLCVNRRTIEEGKSDRTDMLQVLRPSEAISDGQVGWPNPN